MSRYDGFKPWDDPALKAKFPVKLDIAEPPCVKCKHWNPVAHTDSSGIFIGVTLCHNRDGQQTDFSCFDSRGATP